MQGKSLNWHDALLLIPFRTQLTHSTKLAAVVAQTSLEFVWRTSDHHTHERLNERARKLSMAICAHDVEWRASCPVEDAAFAEPS
jgi:hypothetical protein